MSKGSIENPTLDSEPFLKALGCFRHALAAVGVKAGQNGRSPNGDHCTASSVATAFGRFIDARIKAAKAAEAGRDDRAAIWNAAGCRAIGSALAFYTDPGKTADLPHLHPEAALFLRQEIDELLARPEPKPVKTRYKPKRGSKAAVRAHRFHQAKAYRRVWSATSDVLGFYFRPEKTAGLPILPPEVAAFLLDVIDQTIRGGRPEAISALNVRGRAGHPNSVQEAIHDALRYSRAAQTNRIDDPAPVKTICEAFGIDRSTYEDWCIHPAYLGIRPRRRKRPLTWQDDGTWPKLSERRDDNFREIDRELGTLFGDARRQYVQSIRGRLPTNVLKVMDDECTRTIRQAQRRLILMMNKSGEFYRAFARRSVTDYPQ